MTKQVKEIYDAIKELQEEFLKHPPRDDFNRGYFAALSKSLVVINEKGKVCVQRKQKST